MRNGKSVVRALVAVLGLLGVAPVLSGCEGAEASLPPTKHVAPSLIASQPAHTVFAEAVHPVLDSDAPSASVDLATILTGARVITRSAERTAAELPALRRAITLCALALFGIGVLNAALLGAILQALRALLRASAKLGTSAVAAPTPAAGSAAIEQSSAANAARTCSGGTAVSSRSRSGRCRRCAKRINSAHAVA
ncbi:MAG: hypothetical protein ABI186_02060 [Candidatus Elarobacter sp.]